METNKIDAVEETAGENASAFSEERIGNVETVSESVWETRPIEENSEEEFGEEDELREQCRRTVRLAQGRQKNIFDSQAEEVSSEDGEWQAVDNSLTLRTAEEENDFVGYENSKNLFRVKIAENAKNPILMRLTEGTSKISISLKEHRKTKSGRLASRKGKVSNFSQSVRMANGKMIEGKSGEISFRNLMNYSDLSYRVEGDKIKESIVVKEKAEEYRFTFCFVTENARMVTEDETIGIYCEEKKIFTIPEPFMEDAAGSACAAVTYELTEKGIGVYELAIVADAEWINEDGRVFPVTIDPTIMQTSSSNLTLSSVVKSTTTQTCASGSGTVTKTTYSSSSLIRAGKNGMSVYRSYIKLQGTELFGTNITNAQLQFTLSSAYSGSDEFYVSRVVSAISSSSFASQAAMTDILAFSDDKKTATVDITPIMRKYAEGSSYGISVYGDESSGSSYINISSVKLIVTCQDQRAKAGSSFQKNDVRRAGKSAVDLFSGRLLFEHKDVELTSEVLPLTLSHTYNSDYYNEEVSSYIKVGKGWRLNLQQMFAEKTYSAFSTTDGSKVYIYTDGAGLQHEITKKTYNLVDGAIGSYGDTSTRQIRQYCSDGSYTEYSSKEGLTTDYPTSGTMKITDKSGIVTTFAASNRISTIKGNNKTMSVVYQEEDRISTVTDGAGKSAVFSYDSDHYLTEITSCGKAINFTYCDGYLTKITYPDGTCTQFTYTSGRLSKVVDQSGYQLDYSYTDGKVTKVQEQTYCQTIGATTRRYDNLISGDCWTIAYLNMLQAKVTNRNGLAMVYVFDADGNTITMYEDTKGSTSEKYLEVTGNVVHRNSFVSEILSTGSSSYYQPLTKTETIEATLYNAENKIAAIENWQPTWSLGSGEGKSSVCYADTGTSYAINGNSKTTKSLYTSVLPSESGVYVFGLWAKAENSLASVSGYYGDGTGRYFGLLVTITNSSGVKTNRYVSFDPYNPNWQMAAIAVRLSASEVSHIDVKALYAKNAGIVYFDKPYFGKSNGGVTYLYDNCYSETWYRDYLVVTMFDKNMNDVRNVIKYGSSYYITTNTFDSGNRPKVTKNYRGVQTSNAYNIYGNLTSKTTTSSDGLKLYEVNAYDSGNYQTSLREQSGSLSSFGYDSVTGYMTTSTMPTGLQTSYEYSNMEALKAVSATVDGVENKNKITYQYGLIAKLVAGNTTYEFTYDDFGRIEKVTAGDSTILTNTYTDFGTDLDGVEGAVSRVISTDAVGNTTKTYTDKYGRSLGTKQNSEKTSTEEYDAADNLTKHIDNQNAIEYNYSYNEAGNLTEYSEETSDGTPVYQKITYDAIERPLKSEYTVNGKSYTVSSNYTSYPDDEVESCVTPLGTASYERDGLSRVKTKTVVGASVTATESYDYRANTYSSVYTSGLVQKKTFTIAGKEYVRNYAYDSNGNITQITDGNNVIISSYAYDELNRLTRENINGYKTRTYSYDGNGNITQENEYVYSSDDALGAFQFGVGNSYLGSNWGDRLSFFEGGVLGYDKAGNVTDYCGTVLLWEKGRLASFGSVGFSYNDGGVRTQKGSTKYYVKGTQILAEQTGSNVTYYYYDESGIAGFEYNGTKYTYFRNLQGDIEAIFDPSGNVVGQYVYDAWGNILSETGAMASVNPFRYRGYYYDTETKMYYLNSRYYDPLSHRFLSADQVDILNDTYNQLNGLNLYAYCYNNPVMMTDPDGAFTLTWWQKLLIGIAFIALGAIVTALSGGSFIAAFVCALQVAMKSAVTGAIVGAVIGGLTSAFKGEDILNGTLEGFKDGFCNGFMWGGISAGLTNVVKPGSFCFVAGTKVLTENGHKNIEEIEVGDRVWSYNEETGEYAYKPVLRLFRNESKELAHVTIDGNEIVCTPGHKFFTKNRGWQNAKDLKKSDCLLLADGKIARINDVYTEKLEKTVTVYNFEVEEFHTYFVANCSVLVHNLNCHVKGKQGEDYVSKVTGLKKNNTNYEGAGIPDFVEKGKRVIESKNVASQSFTAQLKRYLAFAQENGMSMELYVRQGTHLSSALQKSGIIIKFFSW